jgi:hypothetical protein
MTGTFIFLTILILSLAVWGLIQIGIRIGGVRAARHIAEGLIPTALSFDLCPFSRSN